MKNSKTLTKSRKSVFLTFHFSLFTFLLLFMACEPAKQKLQYPVTKKVDTIDTYHGTQVADPYRWLENDTSAETAAWVKAQNEVTFNYLNQIPFRKEMNDRLTKIWNYERYGAPFHKGNYYFFYKNTGLQNQSVLYVQEGLTGESRVLIDPNTLSKDGTVALSDIESSHDGKYLAYQTATGGSDWNEIWVLDVASGTKLDDHLEWVKFSNTAWYKDGFFYSRYDAPAKGTELSKANEYHKIYYHKIGTKQSDDQLVYENKNFPLRNYGAEVTNDQKFLIISESESTSGVGLYFKSLDDKNAKFEQLAAGFEYEYDVLDHIDGKFIIHTTYKAPKYRIIAADVKNFAQDKWTDIVPEQENVLDWCKLAGGKIVAHYMQDARSKVVRYGLDGKNEGEIPLPTLGTASGFNGSFSDSLAFFNFSSFTVPSTVYQYSFKTNTTTVHFEPKIDIDFNQFETKQVFCTSKDGTKVPLFIVSKKGVALNGDNPTLLYGYGGFNVSLTPTFSTARMVWLENGGIYVMANLRGGGEYGQAWHDAGTKLKKQNVFDDFIAAAEYLVAEKYTSSQKLAIWGGSNGGLLIGACINQRPDLYRVAIPAVGVMDMLRFHKFTIGWAWVSDYGSSDNKDEFEYIYKYSPLHNIRSGINYPAVLVTTADHDDRVVPAHSFKYIATLQEKHTGDNPTLVRIETMAGHGAGKPTAKLIEESTDIYSFIFHNMGINPYSKK